jgi:hypothetical protein
VAEIKRGTRFHCIRLRCRICQPLSVCIRSFNLSSSGEYKHHCDVTEQIRASKCVKSCGLHAREANPFSSPLAGMPTIP